MEQNASSLHDDRYPHVITCVMRGDWLDCVAACLSPALGISSTKSTNAQDTTCRGCFTDATRVVRWSRLPIKKTLDHSRQSHTYVHTCTTRTRTHTCTCTCTCTYHTHIWHEHTHTHTNTHTRAHTHMHRTPCPGTASLVSPLLWRASRGTPSCWPAHSSRTPQWWRWNPWTDWTAITAAKSRELYLGRPILPCDKRCYFERPSRSHIPSLQQSSTTVQDT